MWKSMPDQVKEDYGKELFDKKVSANVIYCHHYSSAAKTFT